jgi:hypothetical protein
MSSKTHDMTFQKYLLLNVLYCGLDLMCGPNHIQILVFFMQFSCHRLLQPDTWFLQTKTQVKKIIELTLLCCHD